MELSNFSHPHGNITQDKITQDKTLIDLLLRRAQNSPQQRAYTFLKEFPKDGETEAVHLTYGQLSRQAQAIAQALQTMTAVGDRVLLLFPPGLDFVPAFLGCVWAQRVAVPAYPPRRNVHGQRLREITQDCCPSLILTTQDLLDSVHSHVRDLDFGAIPRMAVESLETTGQIPRLEDELSPLNPLSPREMTEWEMTDFNSPNFNPPDLDPKTLAFLQYTSGSTGNPKGVMVSHGNILYNQQMITAAFQTNARSVVLGWLPLFHDMGLIGNILHPLYQGIPCILMSPTAFLQQPSRWLHAISQYGATVSGGPSFAYDLCVDRITPDQKARLDLSGWRVAFCGAEPVHAQTLQRFGAAFANCGFRPEAFHPCYGLAEATLLVSGGNPERCPNLLEVENADLEQHRVFPLAQPSSLGSGLEAEPLAQSLTPSLQPQSPQPQSPQPQSPQPSKKLVSCGYSMLEQSIIIVNPDSKVLCLSDQVGEIWVAGDNVAQGYWQREQETQATFAEYLADCPNDIPSGPYMRTGDLGFMDDNGELFVTGRLKDVIILHGRNYYPQDIEQVVADSYPALRPHGGAAFSVDMGGKERLVLVQEVDRATFRSLKPTSLKQGKTDPIDTDEISQAIRQAIAKAIATELEVAVYSIVLIKTGTLLKTSSGKVQRRACRQAFLEGTLDVVAQWTLQRTLQRTLQPPSASAASQTGESVPLASQVSISSDPSSFNESPAKVEKSMVATLGQVNQAQGPPSPNPDSQAQADQLIQWLRHYASERINSRLIDERRCIPPYIVLDFGNQGLMGMQVPQRYGGKALSYFDTFRVFEQLGAIDLTLATLVGVHHTLGTRPIVHFAPRELRETLLPILAQGRELAAFAMTEPGAGSNPRGIVSRAQGIGSGQWSICGEKIWIGNGSWAGVTNVFVQAFDAHQRPLGITGFAVRRGVPGFRQGPEFLTMGLRGMVQNSLHFEDVAVDTHCLLGGVGQGLAVAQDAMMLGRLGVGVLSLGGMKRCAQLMVRYGSRRSITTGRLLDNPVTLMKLGQVSAGITAIETLVFTVAQFLDRGIAVPEEVYSVCKICGSEFYGQATDQLVQLLGGRGYMETNLAPQMWRDARLLRIYEGPTETLTMFLGSRMVQQPAPLQQFLVNTLRVPAIAQRLQTGIGQVRDRLNRGQQFSTPAQRSRWLYSAVGELVNWGVLLAAVQAKLQQTQDFPSLQISQPLPRSQHLEALQRSATWLDLKFEQTLQQLLQGSPEEHVVCGASTITAEIQDYMTTIGQVDQTLAGELHDLDPYLEPDLPHHSPARYSFPLTTSKPSPSQNSQPSNPTVRERASIVDPTVVDPTVVDPTVVAFAVDFPADPAIVEPTIAPPIEPSPAAPPVRVPEPIPARAGTILLSEKMISNWIQQWLQRQSGLELEAITAEVVFADYGMDSVLAIELVRDLETWLQISLDATLLWNFPTLGSLAQYLFQLAAGKASDLAPENRGKNIDTSHDPKVSLPAPSPTLPASPTPQPELVSPVNLEMAVATELAQLEALLQE